MVSILNLFEVEPPFSVTLIQIKARGTLSKFPEDLWKFKCNLGKRENEDLIVVSVTLR